MEYFLATIQVEKGFYSKLILAENAETANKMATEFGVKKHGKRFASVFISETLKQQTDVSKETRRRL